MFYLENLMKMIVRKMIMVIFSLIYFGLFHQSILAQVLEYRVDANKGDKRLPSTNQNNPMNFSTFAFCPGSGCPGILLAEGLIQIDTIDKLKRYLAEKKENRYFDTVCFNSPGGNLVGAIRLGREIRKHGYNTCFLDKYTEEKPSEEIIIHTDKSVCYSACTFAFIGGVKREIEPGARFGVHQFAGKDGDIGDSATQFTISNLYAYLDEMGIDRKLLDIASNTPPDMINVLPLETLKKLKVDNMGTIHKNEWSINVSESGIPFAYTNQEHPSNKISMTLIIFRSINHDILMRIIYDYDFQKDQFRKISDLVNVFDKDTTIDIILDEGRIVHYENLQYRLLNKTVMIDLILEENLINSILNSRKLELSLDIPNAYRDLNPSAELSLNGFSRIIKTVLR